MIPHQMIYALSSRRTYRYHREVPELPEVERAVRELRPAMEGTRFARVIARRRRLRTVLPPRFETRLEGATVRALRRRGKYLVADLSTGATLVMHLGMSGSFEIRRSEIPFSAHDHVIFYMANGSIVVFNDPRRFGSMWLYEDPRHRSNPIGGLGLEPLEEEFTADLLARALYRKRAPLKSALLDQRVIAGLGNIYVSEALHRARLSPRRAAGTLVSASLKPRPALTALVQAIRETLNDALVDAGAYEQLCVYDREGESCPRRGCGGKIKRIVQAGRSTFYCPRCQR